MKTGHYRPHLLLSLNFLNNFGRKFNKFSESFYFFEKSSDLVELYLFLYPEYHFRFKNRVILTAILTRKLHPFLFFFIGTIKDCLKKYFTLEIRVFINIFWKMSAKTIGNSYFYLKNDLFWVHKWAIVNDAHF